MSLSLHVPVSFLKLDPWYSRFYLTAHSVMEFTLHVHFRAVSVVTDGRFGPGKDPIWLSNPACVGTESDIYQCSLTDGWDNNTCTHASDVGIQCGMKIDQMLAVSLNVKRQVND